MVVDVLLGHGEMLTAELTADQLRAARALVRWSARALAERAGVHVATVQRMERCTGTIRGNVSSLLKIKGALENAGIEFLADGESRGVQLRNGALEHI